MLLKVVDALSGEAVFSCGVPGTTPTLAPGDIFVAPEQKQYRILQRAMIAHEVDAMHDGLVEIGGQKAVDFELQLACCPIGMEDKYQRGN